jgi:hypothetical protein
MPSGYEKSPDYGGPDPRWPNRKELLFVATAVIAAVALWLAVYY